MVFQLRLPVLPALCALLDCALGFFPCYFLFGCKHYLYYCLAHASELETHQVKVRSTCPTVRTRIGTTNQCCMYTKIDASGIDASQTVGHQLVRSTVM